MGPSFSPDEDEAKTTGASGSSAECDEELQPMALGGPPEAQEGRASGSGLDRPPIYVLV